MYLCDMMDKFRSVARSFLLSPRPDDIRLDDGARTCLMSAEQGPSKMCRLCYQFYDRFHLIKALTYGVELGNLDDLLGIARKGCSLALHVYGKFTRENAGPIPSDATHGRIRMIFDIDPESQKSQLRGCIKGLQFELTYYNAKLRNAPVGRECFSLFAYTDKASAYPQGLDAGASYYLANRPPNFAVGSDAAFRQAHYWLQTCIARHDGCTKPCASFVPTRLIQISPEPNQSWSVRLFETQQQVVPYAALSYIWGSSMEAHRTTEAKYKRYLRRLPKDDLPTTIQDAIQCVRRLGLNYLWVDSLCIVQDREEDLAHELSTMSNIFKEASVTISAASASDSDEGFLHLRKDLLRDKKRFFMTMSIPRDPDILEAMVECMKHVPKRPGGIDKAQKESFTAHRYDSDEFWTTKFSGMWLVGHNDNDDRSPMLLPDLNDEPISQRAWTLQESLLSPRQLIYTSRQLLWKCKECSMADVGEVGSLHLGLKPTLLDESFRKKPDSNWNVGPWEEIVKNYSKRNLSYRADKLRALSAIVQEIEKEFGKEYFVGLWKDEIVRGLSWYQQPSLTNPKETLSWSGLDGCPTFSWLKVDGEVRFQVEESTEITIDDLGVHHNKVVGTWPDQELRISAFIKLTGLVSRFHVPDIIKEFGVFTFNTRPGHVENMIWADGGSRNPFIKREPGSSDGPSPSLYGRSALSEKITLPTNLKFLELSRGRGLRGLEQSLGLILVPCDESNSQYYRIGFFAVSLERDTQERAGKSRRTKTRSTPAESSIRVTEFGRRWKNSLRQESLVLV